jgi:predicted Zn-dependent protease
MGMICAAERTGEGEQKAEAAGGRVSIGAADSEGHPKGKLLSPERRRTAVRSQIGDCATIAGVDKQCRREVIRCEQVNAWGLLSVEGIEMTAQAIFIMGIRALSYVSTHGPRFSRAVLAGTLSAVSLPSLAQTNSTAQPRSSAKYLSSEAIQEAPVTPAKGQSSDSESEADQLSEQAKRALAAQHWAEAAAALEKLAHLAPTVPEVHANLGMAYYFQGRPDEALASFDRALKLKPKIPQVRIMAGICQAELGRNREAITVLAPAFRKPSDQEIGRLIGLHLQQAYSELKQHDNATATGEELLRRYPDDAEIIFQVSRLYADRSYELMSHLMRSDPDSAWVHYANAQVQDSLARYEVARQEYENVLKRQPAMPGVHYRLGRVILLGAPRTPESLEEASRAFEEELAISPRHPDAEYELGEINREQSRYDLALDHFSRAVSQQPDFIEARIGLGRTLLKVGQTAQAVPHLKEAARLDPENKVPHALLARAYRALGDSAASQAEIDAYRKLGQSGTSTFVPAVGARTAQQIDP